MVSIAIGKDRRRQWHQSTVGTGTNGGVNRLWKRRTLSVALIDMSTGDRGGCHHWCQKVHRWWRWTCWSDRILAPLCKNSVIGRETNIPHLEEILGLIKLTNKDGDYATYLNICNAYLIFTSKFVLWEIRVHECYSQLKHNGSVLIVSTISTYDLKGKYRIIRPSVPFFLNIPWV